ncbi:hypothetical protein H8959_002599 [Pygathrix nigripes]
MAKLYQDDKQFVDMPLSIAPEQVLQIFTELARDHNHSIPRGQLQVFVQEHFQVKGLQPWTPADWKDSPQFLQKISDAKLRVWAGQLHQLWKKLGKKMKPEVLSHPERFSLIYSEHPFIVPGGRFVEFYYWDSYWVMEGLLLSEMAETVKGMLQNFLDLVKTYGHVPNGGRVYYLQRSQPPLLTLMMDCYLTHTNDTTFLQENIEMLALELDFWTKNTTVSVSLEGKNYLLNRYYVPYGGPRPESYNKDRELADTLPEGEQQQGEGGLGAGRLSTSVSGSGLLSLAAYPAAGTGWVPCCVLTGDREPLWGELKAGPSLAGTSLHAGSSEAQTPTCLVASEPANWCLLT